ncbi:hypothetical protein ACIQXD_00390 [Streptomyces uncialis]|uniref:hypothetical protein n=1 Tax=Streptomyces uncialis TaxID=1048205 RepID=UPI00382EA822
MLKRLGVLAGATVATAGLLMASAPTASADPFFRPHMVYPTSDACHAAGKAGSHLWGLIYKCEPFQGRTDAWLLSVRI